MGGAGRCPDEPAVPDRPGRPAQPWNWGNYADILGGQFAQRFWGQLWTSSLIAIATTAGVVILGTSVAYAIARFPMRGTGALFSVFAAGLMFPATVGILPTWIIINEIGLVGNPLGVIIPQVAFALPTTVVILTPFVKAIPNEIEEPRRSTARPARASSSGSCCRSRGPAW